VVSFGSTLGSRQTYLKRIETRATKLCGDAGFEYENLPKTEVKSSISPVGGKLQDVSYNQMTRIVVCKEKQ